jgi:hypothetical protein
MEWVPRTMSALEFYDTVNRGDYCELLWIDGRRQVKVVGAMMAVGAEKPILIVGSRGEVIYALAPDDRAVILVPSGTPRQETS